MPSKVLRSTLTPNQLFTKVSPAVYALAARAGYGTGNIPGIGGCRLVEGSHHQLYVCGQCQGHYARQCGHDAQGRGCSADPQRIGATSKCWMANSTLSPALGTTAVWKSGKLSSRSAHRRVWSTRFGNGLLSGLRKSEGAAEYIQITAPVSEGSSGGGLFDDRGNLIGVTTFTVRDSREPELRDYCIGVLEVISIKVSIP